MIIGKKVRLRSHREDDLKNIVAWINNPAVTRYLSMMRPRSVVEEREWLQRAMRNEDPGSFGLVIESADAEYLGSVGLIHIDPRNRCAEVGLVIARPEDWGRGFGTEALTLMLRHAFEEMNLHRVMLRVYDFNERAVRSYASAGLKEEGRLREALFRHGAWHDVILMAILAREFFERHGRTEDGKVLDAAGGQ